MLDFLRARMFRETLLCRAERAVRRVIFPPRICAGSCYPREPRRLPENRRGPGCYAAAAGIKMEANHAGAIALIEELEANSPRPVGLADLEPRLAGAGLLLDQEGVKHC